MNFCHASDKVFSDFVKFYWFDDIVCWFWNLSHTCFGSIVCFFYLSVMFSCKQFRQRLGSKQFEFCISSANRNNALGVFYFVGEISNKDPTIFLFPNTFNKKSRFPDLYCEDRKTPFIYKCKKPYSTPLHVQ